MIDRRAIRRRGILREIGGGIAAARAEAEADHLIRLRRINHVAATAFLIGGSLFALAAALSQAGVGAATLPGAIYLVGGFFFSLGGYGSVAQASNIAVERGGGLAAEEWRWWRWNWRSLGWLSAAILFAGTLFFAVSLVDALVVEAEPRVVDHLVWAPEMIGCVLFLVSGQIAIAEVGGGRLSPGWEPRDLGWWIVVVNQLGSALFLLAGVSGFVHTDGDKIAAGLANFGTLTGALCFAIAGLLQEYEAP